MQDIFGIQQAHGFLHQDECFTPHPFIQWLSHKSCHFRDGRVRLIFSLPEKVWSCISHTNGLNISQLNIMGWIVSFFPWNCTSSYRKNERLWKFGWGKDKDVTALELQSYRGNEKNIWLQLTLCVYSLKLYRHWNSGLPFARWVVQPSVFLWIS